MYHEFFGIEENPFSITPDPRYLYMSKGHQEALAHLLYGVSESGGFVLLTGEVGTGKTSVCRCLLEQLPSAADVALVLNPRLSETELLANICDELGVGYPAGTQSLKVLVDLLNRHLLDLHAKGRHGVVIIDEAQNLSPDVLEQVRLLTNLETAKRKLLQIILIGQPELHDLVNRREMRQLAQRITARYHLKPLSRSETVAYIQHRLAVGGLASTLFSRGAIASIYRRSHGVPRVINSLSDRCLLGAYAQNRKSVTRGLVRQAAVEVFGKRHRSHYRVAAASWFAAMMLVGAALFFASPTDRAMRLTTIDGPGEPAAEAGHPGPGEAGRLDATEAESAPADQVLGAIVDPGEDTPAPSQDRAEGTAATGTADGAAKPAEVLQFPQLPGAEKQAAITQQIGFDSYEAPGLRGEKELWVHDAVERVVMPAAAPQSTAKILEAPVQAAALANPAGNLTVEALLSRGEAGTGRDAATAALLGLWGLDRDYSDIDEFCVDVGDTGLKCLRGKGTWDDMSAFDRPALITLEDSLGWGGPVVISALNGDRVTLRVGARRVEADVAKVKSLWSGEYLLLWRPPAVYRRVLGRGSKGEDVLWLKRRLAEIDGSAKPEGRTAVFDGELRKAVVAFQASRGLKPDGKVGAHTLIHLNSAADLPEVPRLREPAS